VAKSKPPQRRRDSNEAPTQLHAFDCEKRDSDDPDNLVECLYLYREFHSEALRILVPYTPSGMGDELIQSFMASLQLGLKRRFGGKVDHLRIVTQDEPGQDGGPRRVYVLLYDSVPGGTGYLHQLLSHDAQTLVDVLRLAFDALARCSCNNDPEKDGCYQCVYQYRLGRMMEKVSRIQAATLLGELLGSIDSLRRVATQ
jgi:DEAD/DEAH box helicase domain-containing protein